MKTTLVFFFILIGVVFSHAYADTIPDGEMNPAYPNSSVTSEAGYLHLLHQYQDLPDETEQGSVENFSDLSFLDTEDLAIDTLDHPDEAVTAALRALESDPDNAELWVYLGYAYDVLDDTKQAFESYETAIHMTSPSVDAFVVPKGPVRSKNTVHVSRALVWRDIGIVFSDREPIQETPPLYARMIRLENSLAFISEHSHAPRVLIINIDLREMETNQLSQNSNYREQILQKIQASSISLDSLSALMIRIWDPATPGSMTKVVYQGESLKQKIQQIKSL